MVIVCQEPSTKVDFAIVFDTEQITIVDALTSAYIRLQRPTDEMLRGSDVNGVVLMVSALESSELNELVRELQAAQVHIHLSNGVRDIA